MICAPYSSVIIQNRDLEVLESDFKVLTLPDHRADGQILDNYSAGMPNFTYYRLIISFTPPHPQLGGKTFYVEGVKTSGDYEYQTAMTYSGDLSGTEEFRRCKHGGVWNGWKLC